MDAFSHEVNRRGCVRKAVENLRHCGAVPAENFDNVFHPVPAELRRTNHTKRFTGTYGSTQYKKFALCHFQATVLVINKADNGLRCRRHWRWLCGASKHILTLNRSRLYRRFSMSHGKK